MVDEDGNGGSGTGTTTGTTGTSGTNTGTGSALSHHNNTTTTTSDQTNSDNDAKKKAAEEAAALKKKKLAELAKQRQTLVTEQKGHMTTIKNLSTQLAEHSKEADKHTVDLKQLKDTETSLEAKLADVQKQGQGLKKTIHKLQKELDEMKQKYEENIATVKTVDLDKTNVSQQLFETMELYKQSNAKFSQTKADIAAAKEKADAASKAIEDLEMQMEAVESGKGVDAGDAGASSTSTTTSSTSNTTTTSNNTTTTSTNSNDNDETNISAFVRACVKCGESFNEDEQTCDFHCSSNGDTVEVGALMGECMHCQLDAASCIEIFNGKCMHTVF
eukprot:TRINITY_DN1772_c0_g1_i12.p2 TRINITY_DN1772_c0_g1~~TRINITY_DN1772_c0_g1_i12.p2  ORF type:complete len:331 (+),score=145.80 TRINITY_DN1772_c0_g1_i12:1734-2726(+)